MLPFDSTFELFLRVASQPFDFSYASTFWSNIKRLELLFKDGLICFDKTDPSSGVKLTSLGQEKIQQLRITQWSQTSVSTPGFYFARLFSPCGLSPAIRSQFEILDLITEPCNYPHAPCSKSHWTFQGEELVKAFCLQHPQRVTSIVLDSWASVGSWYHLVKVFRMIPKAEWAVLIALFSSHRNFQDLVDLIFPLLEETHA